MKGFDNMKFSKKWLDNEENMNELLKVEVVEYLSRFIDNSIDLYRSLFVTESGKVYSRKDSYDTLIKKYNIREE